MRLPISMGLIMLAFSPTVSLAGVELCQRAKDLDKRAACECSAEAGGEITPWGKGVRWKTWRKESFRDCYQRRVAHSPMLEGAAACAKITNRTSRAACMCSVNNGGYATYKAGLQISWKNVGTPAYSQCLMRAERGM